MTGSRTAAVVVNRNAGAHLARTLEAIAGQTVAPHRVIVVDNASDDGSLDGLEARFPWVEVVRSDENLGFAAGNNLAVRMCGDCDFVALLNPDAFPEPGWLQTLLAVADAHPECAAFGSRLVLDGDRGTLDGAGDEYHVGGIAWRRDQGAPVTVERPQGESFSVCAAAALYRRDAFLAVGGFDEDFFCYYEDTDLAFRLRLAGHRILSVPEATAYHVGSATAGLLSSFTVYHSARNQLWTYVKNMPGPLLWLYLPQHVLVSVLTTIVYTLGGRGRAAVAGRRDALLGLPRVLAQRRRIQASRTATSAELRRAMATGAAGYMHPLAIRVREWTRRRAATRAADGAARRAALPASRAGSAGSTR